MKKLTLKDLKKKKESREKISFITAYDAPTAKIAEEAGIDLILVGDSVANNVLGYKSTNPVTIDEMLIFARAARRGALNTFIIGDMPFLSYQISNESAIKNAGRFIQEAEMDAVKLEGGIRMAERVRAIYDAGIAVMGHIGYTPQSTNLEGKVRCRTIEDFKNVYEDAFALQEAGAFAILLEAIPAEPAGLIAENLVIPIYGIGAGNKVDGILSILHDVVGLGDFEAAFVRRFSNARDEIKRGITNYIAAVRSDEYPSNKECYKISSDESEKEEILKGIKMFIEEFKSRH